MTVEEKKRFEKIEAQMTDMRKHSYSIEKKMDQVLDMLDGDRFARGVIDTVKDHEARIKKLEDLKNRATWTILGMSIPSGYGLWEIFRKILPPLLVLVLFTGCMSQKKREDAFHRYARENPLELAKLSHQHYPVQARQGTVTHDTLTRVVLRDSVDCPDSTRVPCPPCEERLVSSYRVDTVPDMALVEILNGKVTEMGKEIAVLENTVEVTRSASKRKTLWIIALGAAVLIQLYLKIKKII